jgi:disulfide bond formation protein DsbB
MESTTAVLALLAAAGAVLVVVARLLAGRSTVARRLGSAVVARRGAVTLAIGAVAMGGSLYFSEVADYVPCRLCWFQRIAMYPIALVALVALVRRDTAARWYVVPMAAVGAAVSTYHYLIERGVLNDSDSCALFGPSCADVWFEEFGFVTLAFMALAGFVAVVVVNVVEFPNVVELSSRSTEEVA